MDLSPSPKVSVILEPIQELEWLKFALKSPSATIFHHPVWMKLLSTEYGFQPFQMVEKSSSGDILAGLPIMKTNGLIQSGRWISLPYTDHCEPLFQRPDNLNNLFCGMQELIRKKGQPWEFRWAFPQELGLIQKFDFVMSKVALGPDPEMVAGRIKKKQFRQIRISQERGVQTILGTDTKLLEDFYLFHVLNRRKHGLPVQPWGFFRKIQKLIFEEGMGFTVCGYRQNECVAGAVFLCWNKTITYKYAASNEEGRHLMAMDQILWKAITWACEHGYEWLDMGRSNCDEMGLREYKSRWGAVEIPLIYSYFPFAVETQSGGLARSLLAGFIRRTPPWVCKLMGECLYRYFG